MVYKFFVGSEESGNFKLEIVIDSGDTFLRLRNCILDAAGYSKEEMDSFYICNQEWKKTHEVTVMDMGSDSDEDVWLMEDTPLEELLDDEGQKLKFVFDYMTERNFFMILNEIIPGKNLKDPCCQRKVGKAPKQFITEDDLITRISKTDANTNTDDMDEDFYGDEGFNEDELENLGDNFDDNSVE